MAVLVSESIASEKSVDQPSYSAPDDTGFIVNFRQLTEWQEAGLKAS